MTNSEKFAKITINNTEEGIAMITGKKVIIKGISKELAGEIYNIVNKEDFRSLTGTLYPVSEYEHEEWIKRVTCNSEQKLFMVLCKETNCFLGTIGLKNFDHKNRNAELFISLDSPGGYGADAVETLVEYCFKHLNLHKIYLKVFDYNKKAISCYEKAGFIREGILADQHFNDGHYTDVIIMGVIAN
ncbi:MAG: GNAT family N-acetyltransferase [Clostridia bacterium]|nr:GNAT family N-acetyltransferase [Clostridia bacterium]